MRHVRQITKGNGNSYAGVPAVTGTPLGVDPVVIVPDGNPLPVIVENPIRVPVQPNHGITIPTGHRKKNR